MKNKQLITIPLVSLSNDQKRWESGREWEEKIFDNKNYIKILASRELPNFSYGIEVKDPSMVTYFGRNTIVIYSKSQFPAQYNIFLVGLKSKTPFIGKLLKNESKIEGEGRKTFMTPTPLHVPESKTSPIADSLHHNLIFKGLSEPQGTQFIQESNMCWRHPLIYIHKQE